ncbi:hypothetical protein IPdc08_00050 [archaeon]|nr:hypothetical protein IPdc08_00050 [archaeon]
MTSSTHRGANQRYRLTLLNGSGRVIAEELLNKKDPNTIKAFLGRHLNPNKLTFAVTDLYPSYPDVFMEFFGENLIHQFCLLHLNKLIVQDFPKKPSIEELHTMYRLLNIFYNREQELEVLEAMAKEEREVKQGNAKEYNAWLTKIRSIFRAFVYELKLKRRRERKNLVQRAYLEAVEMAQTTSVKSVRLDRYYSAQEYVRIIEKKLGNVKLYLIPKKNATVKGP